MACGYVQSLPSAPHGRLRAAKVHHTRFHDCLYSTDARASDPPDRYAYMPTGVNMPARRCPSCSLEYPVSYSICVACGIRLKFTYDGKPMSAEKIDRLRRAVSFERFYAERERKRVASGDPSPEELGSQEAKAELDRIRELNQHIKGD